jgi:hypothetical protein
MRTTTGQAGRQAASQGCFIDSCLMLSSDRSLETFKDAFEPYIKSGCKFPKWHSTVHYPDFIREFGIPALTYTGWWEKAHRYLCKMPFLRTGRHVARLEELLLLRIALTEIVRRKERALERANPNRQKELQDAILDSYVHSKKRRRGSSQRVLGDDDAYDVQPERLSGRDKNGYLTTGEK